MTKLYTMNGVRGETHLGRTKIYELINEGKLDVIKIGRRTLVTAESVE